MDLDIQGLLMGRLVVHGFSCAHTESLMLRAPEDPALGWSYLSWYHQLFKQIMNPVFKEMCVYNTCRGWVGGERGASNI